VKTKRPKTARKMCCHCERLRLAKFIEWHPGIEEWQCSDFAKCDDAIERRAFPLGRPPHAQ
jgi:hypothetical protein